MSGKSARKPSAAQARRLRAEAIEKAEHPQLPAELAEFLEHYRPHLVDEETWQQLRPFVHAVMVRSHVRGFASFRYHCGALVALGTWARRQGWSVALEALMSHAVIDEFIRTGCADDSEATRGTRRSRLRSLASHVNPGPQAPPPAQPIAHVAVQAPYSDQEMATIVRLARNQPTQTIRRQLCACVGLGAGAGLDSPDLRDLREPHITDRGADGIEINVPGTRPRTVIARAAFEDLIREGLRGLQRGRLVVGHKQDRKKVASQVFQNATVLGDAPELSQARLRATWLAALLTSPVPLTAILDAAGLTSARTLTDLAAQLPQAEIDSASLRGQR